MRLVLGDCLEVMHSIEDGSVDMILADLPYGTTACKWDTVIDLPPLWKHYKRVIKRNGAIVLTASQPFTTTLIASNMEMFKYCWVWRKNNPSGFLNAKKQPLRATEDIPVFYDQQPTYNQQPTRTSITDRRVQGEMQNGTGRYQQNVEVYGAYTYQAHPLKEFVSPSNLLDFPVVPRATGTLHPTQKPVALMEYLIRTYTNEGETVLDNTMGSGTTGVACINTNRNFIGIERDPAYFEIAQQRIDKAANQARQMEMTA